MQIQGTILLVIAGIELILGLYLFFRHSKNHVTISYSLFIFGVVVWVVANALAILEQTSSLFWWKMTYVGGLLFVCSFLYFAMAFPYFKRAISNKVIVSLYSPIIYFLVIIFNTDLIVEKLISNQSGITNITLGPMYHLCVMFIVGYWLIGLYYLVTKFKTSDGIHRWQLKYLLWGIIISSVIAITSDLIIPFFSKDYLMNYPWLGSAFSIVWLSFTSYIVFKKPN